MSLCVNYVIVSKCQVIVRLFPNETFLQMYRHRVYCILYEKYKRDLIGILLRNESGVKGNTLTIVHSVQ
jgi:hypothetical protein